MNIPIVSICCQTYNHKNYIREAIESFLMQKTNFNFEILLRDDASTDGTAEICKDYASKHPDLINLLAYEENQFKKGISPFRDNVKRARGKYIAICEGDDYWTDPLKLQKQVDLMEKNSEASMCVALCGTYNNKDEYSVQEVLEKDEYKLLYLNDIRQYYHTSTYLIRNDLLKRITYEYSHLMVGDTALRYLMLAEGPFILINEEVSVYRQTGEGIWTSLDKTIQLKQNYLLFRNLRKKHFSGNRNIYLHEEISHLIQLVRVQNYKHFFIKIHYLLLILPLILKFDFTYISKIIKSKIKNFL